MKSPLRAGVARRDITPALGTPLMGYANRERVAKTVRDPLNVTCRCGGIFPIVFEGRKYYRKPTHLPGRYTQLVTQEAGPLLIRNLSFTGVGCVTTLSHHLQVGDMVELSFILDDPRHSAISRRARIQHVFHRAVGAAFCNLYAYEKELGFYLFGVFCPTRRICSAAHIWGFGQKTPVCPEAPAALLHPPPPGAPARY